MRLTRPFSLAVFVLVLTSLSANTLSAQIMRGIGRRAADAVERKVDQKIDQKIEEAAERLVNRAFDSMFAEDTTGASSSSSKPRRAPRFSIMPNAPTEAVYAFDAVLNYEIESQRGNDKPEKGVMKLLFNKDGLYAGTQIVPENPDEEGEAIVIFDVKNESMVMLFDSKDGKFSMAYSWKGAKQYLDSAAAANPPSGTAAESNASVTTVTTPIGVTYSNLGTKTIAGFKADGYRSTNAQGEVVDVWVSNDPAIAYSRLMGASTSVKQVRSTVPSSYPEGMLLEVQTTNRDGEKGRMTVTSIDTKANMRIDMEQYPKVGSK